MDGYVVIKKASDSVLRICGFQKYDNSQQYKLSVFVLEETMPNGILYHSCLTGELLMVFDEKKALPYLVSHWFFVSTTINEKENVPKIQKLLKLLGENQKHEYDYFEILTTTSCNANCFYCYEIGYEQMSMDYSTAISVVDFIEKHIGKNKIKIRWYGGEPLLNTDAIKTICRGLKNRSIDFESSIISNGLLFSDEIIKDSLKLWNLKNVRITIDGTNSVYNKVKRFKNLSSDPFVTVMNNINRLLESNIKVQFRINIGSYNLQDSQVLIDSLISKYNGNNLVSFSINQIHNTRINDSLSSQNGTEDDVLNKLIDIKEMIYEKGFMVNFPTLPYLSTHFCQADDNKHILIKPNGELAFCAEDFDGKSYGSIQSGLIHPMPRMDTKTYPKGEICDDCPLFASCIISRLCPAQMYQCSKKKKQLIIRETKLSMKMNYRQFILSNLKKD